MRAPGLEERRASVEHDCTECGLCVKECGFLKLYGTPGALAAGYDPENPKDLALAFECSLCSLCTSVCPFGIDPKALLLDMRREAVRRGAAPMPEHKGLLGYERAGTSKRFTWYGLPAGCDTIFFPGCALPGTRPGATFDVFTRLRREIPTLGVVLDCCTKPSHDLGRREHFSTLFGELKAWLAGHGVKRVLVACPNCWKVFTEYAPELAVETVYEALDELGVRPAAPATGGTVTIHDPCVMRFAPAPQEAVRALAEAAGLAVDEMAWTRGRTLCCGEGGTVRPLAPSLADAWGERRAEDAAGRPVVTYCAGCAKHLSSRVKVAHVLDVLADPAAALAGRAKVSRGLVTYWNRLRLKARFRREVGASVTRERTFSPGGASPGRGWLKPLVLLLVLAAAVFGVRAAGLGAYLEQEKLRALIAGFGPWAPALYVLLYTVAPALFLPGLPITVVGGILFGPVWGVVYAITGATAGACVAFLVSRYAARSWVERRLVGSRWQKLDEEVAKNGWKVVAFTRLVPLFPFNLLNYALGLTKIGFAAYAVTTFFFMLPACVAFIVFSSSLLGLLRGKVSPSLVVGVLLVVAVSLLPKAVKKLRAARADAPPPRPWSLGRSLRRKAVALAATGAVSAGVFGAVKHFFWALNAYLYTLEFNLLFLVGRLKDSDAALFADYLRPMAAGRFLAAQLGAEFLRAFRFPLSRLHPVAAALAGRGAVQALAGGAAACLAVALAAWGLGRFALGDVIPWWRDRRGLAPEAPPKPRVAWALAVVTALPFVPAALGPALLGAARVPAGPALLVLVLGALARAALSFLL